MASKKILFIWTFLVSGLSAEAQTGCDQRPQKHTVSLIQPIELDTELKRNQNILLLDTRSAEEFQISRIPNALLIDFSTYTNSDLEKFDKSSKVIVYCTAGLRSEQVGERLLKLGFSDVQNLYGGIIEWKNRGFLVLNRFGKPTDSVHVYNTLWGMWLIKGTRVY